MNRDVVLSVTAWANLLAALETIVDRYGLEQVEEAVDHVKSTSTVRISGRLEPFGPDWVHQKVDENQRGYGRKS